MPARASGYRAAVSEKAKAAAREANIEELFILTNRRRSGRRYALLSLESDGHYPEVDRSAKIGGAFLFRGTTGLAKGVMLSLLIW